MKEVGTLIEIGARAGDWVQFEDKAPYESPLTQHEINTDHRTGFRVVKRRPEDRPINAILETISRGEFYADYDQSWADMRTLREALAEKKSVVIDMAGAMDKITPEMIEAMAPLLTNPLIQSLEKRVEELDHDRDEWRQRAADRNDEAEKYFRRLGAAQEMVTALQDALNRVRIAIGMEPGIAGAPGDIATEVEKRFRGDLRLKKASA